MDDSLVIMKIFNSKITFTNLYRVTWLPYTVKVKRTIWVKTRWVQTYGTIKDILVILGFLGFVGSVEFCSSVVPVA